MYTYFAIKKGLLPTRSLVIRKDCCTKQICSCPAERTQYYNFATKDWHLLSSITDLHVNDFFRDNAYAESIAADFRKTSEPKPSLDRQNSKTVVVLKSDVPTVPVTQLQVGQWCAMADYPGELLLYIGRQWKDCDFVRFVTNSMPDRILVAEGAEVFLIDEVTLTVKERA